MSERTLFKLIICVVASTFTSQLPPQLLTVKVLVPTDKTSPRIRTLPFGPKLRIIGLTPPEEGDPGPDETEDVCAYTLTPTIPKTAKITANKPNVKYFFI